MPVFHSHSLFVISVQSLTTNHSPPATSDSERGAALIIALSLLVLIGLLVASAASLSQLTRNTAATATERSELGYAVESLAARTQWFLMYDLNKYKTRMLGESKKEELDEVDRFLADGVIHEFDSSGGYAGWATITDAASGPDISGKDGPSKLKQAWGPSKDDLEEYNNFVDFIDSFTDFVDADEFLGVSGKGHEKSDYLQDGLPNMPRNAPLQFREELLLVYGAEKYVKADSFGRLSNVRLIPLEGLDPINGNDNFMTVDRETLKKKAGLDDMEVELVLKARDLWFKEKIPLSESLDPALLQKVKGKLSFVESGIYTFKIEAGEQKSKRTLFFTLKSAYLMPSYGNRYYEWILY